MDLNQKTGTRSVGATDGHAGVLYGNKIERTVTLYVHKCKTCGRRHLSRLPLRIKMIYNFTVGGAMRI